MKRIFLVLPLVCLIACKTNQSTITVSVENGVTIVRNEPYGPDDGDGIELKRVLEIGSSGTDDAYLFSSIRDIAVDGRGSIYIADVQECQIKKFTADGVHLATIGRKGQGPGEFTRITRLGIGKDDVLLVFDYYEQGISVFSEDGLFLSLIRDIKKEAWWNPGFIGWDGRQYIILSKNEDQPELLHTYNDDWSSTGAFGEYEYIDNRKFEEKFLGGWEGECSFGRRSSSLFYTKYFYDNKFFYYEDGACKRIVETNSSFEKPYDVQFSADTRKVMTLQRSGEYDFFSFTEGEAYYGRSYQQSAGIFQMTGGKIVNFVSIRTGNRKRRIEVQLFEESGELIRQTLLPDSVQFWRINCKDGRDRFYASIYDEIPKVAVFELIYD